MANVNVPQDNRKAKLKRRRREVDRMVAKLRDSAAGRGHPVDRDRLEHQIRTLRRDMRYVR